MPKMKTHRGAAKRFKISGSGKVLRRRSGRGHLKLAKGKDRYRRLGRTVEVKKGDAKQVRRMLGE